MLISYFANIAVGLLVGTGSSALIIFLFKNWVLKQMEHQFNKRIENYKSELGKGNISYQIEKTEFAKKKFKQISLLYTQLLERQKRVEDSFSIVSYQSLIEIRRAYDNQIELDRKLQDDIALASLYLDEEVISEIKSYMVTCYLIMINVISIAEDRLSKEPSQEPFLDYRVVGGGTYDRKKATAMVNEQGKQLRESLKKITTLMREYLSVK